jgi:5'-deoxynucleotidase YfbR-like HD superfamily hydrolase
MKTPFERALAAHQAGSVLRYHAAPTVRPQTVGHHSFGVAVIVIYLTSGDASANLLKAAVLHDTAELFTGDIPFTVKRDNADIKTTFDELENRAYAERLLEMPELTKEERCVLKLADTLEGYLWCVKHESSGPVRSRWKNALTNALVKFADLVSPSVFSNAKAFLTQLHPRNLHP